MLPLLAGSPFGPGCDERVARRRRRRSLLSRLSKSTALAGLLRDAAPYPTAQA